MQHPANPQPFPTRSDAFSVQQSLKAFYPDVERCMSPLLARLGYAPASFAGVAEGYMSVDRVLEQTNLLSRYAGPLSGKRILEVGSGFGLFVAYTNRHLGALSYGIEPAELEFEATYQTSIKLLRAWSIDPDVIQRGHGEKIPFEDNSFDVVYSTNVLEHVQDPAQVLRESVRVLKPGGTLQFVVPNYGSFWEGHYALPWIPYMPTGAARIYLRMFGRDPWFVNSLRLINYFSLKSMVEKQLNGQNVRVIDWGSELFVERMTRAEFSAWGGLSSLKSWVEAAHRLRISGALARLLVLLKAHTPLVLTLTKGRV